MKTPNPANQIGSASLCIAANQSVAIPTSAGYHLARGFKRFALHNVSNPGQLGSDAFTEVYFTSLTGNLYKVWQPKELGHTWVIANVRDCKGSKGALKGYHFPALEIGKAVLEVGLSFRFGGTGATTPITAILAVNAERTYLDTPPELWSDIRNEFDIMVK